MNPVACAWRLAALLPFGLLVACGASQAPDEEGGAARGKVAVTTALPVRQTFRDTVEAWGSAVGDPHRVRTISLAHGGQVVALKVAPGQTVESGQALLVIAPEAAARNAWQQARSALALARGELSRVEQLATQHLATQSQLATARKALADAESNLAAQRTLGGGSAEETVAAPADGVVGALSVAVGERVAANAPLLGFTPAHALVAQLGVQPEEGALLRAGMPVQLRGVYAEEPPVDGRLVMVGQAIDAQTHLLPVQAELPADASSSLVAGAALQARIRTADYAAWAVPRAAVLHDGKGDYLFRIDDGRAKRIDVTLRSPDGDPLGVDGALDAQAKIVVSGAYELGDGDEVREAAESRR